MAHVDIRSRHRVGRYGVDVAVLDSVGVVAIRKAIQSSEIVLVDEIGKMEMFSGEFRGAVLKAMSSPKIVVATVMLRAPTTRAAINAPSSTAYGLARRMAPRTSAGP